MGSGSHTSTTRAQAPTLGRSRALRAQGQRTRQRLCRAGLAVFNRRGYHRSRVEDIVREARTSHGTFYLYFANKEELLAALAAECAAELQAVAARLPPRLDTPDGEASTVAFVEAFLATYRAHAGVIRAWMEGGVTDRDTNRLGVRTFTDIATQLERRLPGRPSPAARRARVAALMAMLERSAYALTSRDLLPGGDGDRTAAVTLGRLVHRGFFAA
jgi:AcrR family transcriptional regulator